MIITKHTQDISTT